MLIIMIPMISVCGPICLSTSDLSSSLFLSLSLSLSLSLCINACVCSLQVFLLH